MIENWNERRELVLNCARYIHPDMKEKRFQMAVERIAEVCGWLHFHARFPSNRGFPDLCLVKQFQDGSSALVFAELKTMKGKFSKEQKMWLEKLEAVGGRVEVCRWRPTDVDAIVALFLYNKRLSANVR